MEHSHMQINEMRYSYDHSICIQVLPQEKTGVHGENLASMAKHYVMLVIYSNIALIELRKMD